jgi:hypothetical protein
MALWKPFLGTRAALNTVEKHAGYVYWCADDGTLHFDYTDAEGVLQRKQINAKEAESLMGTTLDELKSLISTQDAVVLHEAQTYTDKALETATTQDAVILAEAQAYTDAAIAGVGNVDTSNLATVDKITHIDTYYGDNASVGVNEAGVCWEQDFYIDANGVSAEGKINLSIPIIAGNNIEFEVDEENQLVKINATGGGGSSIKYSEGLDYSLNPDGASYSVAGIGTCIDNNLIIPPTYEGLPVTDIIDYSFRECSFNSVVIPKSVTGNTYGMYGAFNQCDVNTFYCEAESQPDGWYPDWAGDTEVVWGYVIDTPSDSGGGNENVASKFTIEVSSETTVWDVLSATQEAGANLNEWNLINTTGHIQTVLGVIYQPFGDGSFGLLRAADLVTMKTAAEVSDWSTIPFSDFTSGMFKCPLPYFDESNVGQVLTVNSNMGVVDAVWGNAGGGSADNSVSLIGTWTVIDEPEIPQGDLPLSFTSNGTEYMAIGTTSMGSSSWGINALSYQVKDAGYYEAAYTNNPSGNYGITHGWSNEAYKAITVTEEPTDPKTIAWLGNNTNAPKIEIPPSLPSCDSSNEGQFLRVVGGVPTWTSVPYAEEVGF